MTNESKTTSTSSVQVCQNCKQSFVIEAQDFDFYKKIDVPPPTFCPNCRMQRRFTYRNERSLYRRQCGLTGKNIISCFSPESGVTVYDRDSWWSDKWDPKTYGRDYDFSKPFFTQFSELLKTVPMPAVFNAQSVRSDYCNHVGEIKDCYLISGTYRGENLFYGSKYISCKDSLDCYKMTNSELCYEDVACDNLYQTFFSEFSENCTNSYFLYDCKGCTNCFGCVNLRNKSYHIFNQPYSKEEYSKELEKLDFKTAQGIRELKKKFEELKKRTLRRYANFHKVENSTGDNLSECFNLTACFDLTGNVKDCKYEIHGGMVLADSYDGYGVGDRAELMYENVDCGVNCQRFLFDIVVWGGHDVVYSWNCNNSSNCFGCVGLRNASYCILNKQYTEEEYQDLLPKVIEHMKAQPYVDQKGRKHSYGEFFPSEISPFAYNETIAKDYFPITEQEAIGKGYNWRPEQLFSQSNVQPALDLPEASSEASPELTTSIIGCERCERPYRIIVQELEFLQRFSLPLPRVCPECRHRERFLKVNLPHLYKRQCMCDYALYKNSISHSHHPNGHCANEFETTYAPDRAEVVYCEQCYQAEVV